MADLPAGAHQCATCPRPIWRGERCGACERIRQIAKAIRTTNDPDAEQYLAAVEQLQAILDRQAVPLDPDPQEQP